MEGTLFLLNPAAVHARRGEVEGALAVLEVILSVPSRFRPRRLEDHLRLQPIQGHPRFQALLERYRDGVGD